MYHICELDKYLCSLRLDLKHQVNPKNIVLRHFNAQSTQNVAQHIKTGSLVGPLLILARCFTTIKK